jgi:hypothetical protein
MNLVSTGDSISLFIIILTSLLYLYLICVNVNFVEYIISPPFKSKTGQPVLMQFLLQTWYPQFEPSTLLCRRYVLVVDVGNVVYIYGVNKHNATAETIVRYNHSILFL